MSYADHIIIDGVQYDIRDAEAVSFEQEQTLTDAQKEQARANIGAGSEADVDDLKSAITELGNGELPFSIVKGEYVAGGQITQHGAWDRSDYIPVEGFDKLVITVTGNRSSWNGFFANNTDTTAISGGTFGLNVGENTINVPTGANYVVISNYVADLPKMHIASKQTMYNASVDDHNTMVQEQVHLLSMSDPLTNKRYYDPTIFQLGAGYLDTIQVSNRRIITTPMLICDVKTTIKSIATTQIRVFKYRADGSYETYTQYSNNVELERGRKYRVEIWPVSGTEADLSPDKIPEYLQNVYMEFADGDYSYRGVPFLPKKIGYDVDQLDITPTQAIQNGGQGLAVYGHTLFNLTSTDKISLYDIDTGTNIAEYTGSVGHGGSAFFSDEFYDSNDSYPLLYVATLNYPGTVNVLRVTDSASTLVKTIVLPTSAGYYPQIAHDKDTDYLFTIGYKNEDFQSANNGNKTIIGVFDLNNLTDNRDNTFTPQLVNLWETRFIYCVQSSVYYNGHLLLLSSYAHAVQKTWLYVVNPFARQIVGILKDFPVLISNWEAEGIDIVDDEWVIIGTRPRFFKLYLSN